MAGRVKSRAFVTSPDAHHVQVDPGGDSNVADGGSVSYNYGFGLGVKGFTASGSTTNSYPTYSGRIHIYPVNPQLYHVSWMAKDSAHWLSANVFQQANGSVLWSLPEGPEPIQGDYQLQVWTCLNQPANSLPNKGCTQA